MKGIIDRFESDKVLLEIDKDGILTFDRELFPKDAKEGDMVRYIDDRFVVDEEGTRDRHRYIDRLFKSLIDKNQ
ncbi:MAG: DUF3006 domain-containing protein [Tissierellia bacterium]|nr:DUF3006 domain-containing protein [Tissierellia bacterium]